MYYTNVYVFWLTAASSPKPTITCCSVLSPEIVMPDAYICRLLQRRKITRKASDTSEYTVSSCSVLSPEIVVLDDAYIGRRSENNIKCVVHDDLGWKNRTTRYILPRHLLYGWFSQLYTFGTYSVLSRSPSIQFSVNFDEIFWRRGMCDTVTVTLPGLKCLISPLFHMNRFIIQSATQVDSTDIANTESLSE